MINRSETSRPEYGIVVVCAAITLTLLAGWGLKDRSSYLDQPVSVATHPWLRMGLAPKTSEGIDQGEWVGPARTGATLAAKAGKSPAKENGADLTIVCAPEQAPSPRWNRHTEIPTERSASASISFMAS